MTHIYIGKVTIIGSDNGLSSGQRLAIIWTSAKILLIGPLGTNFAEILIEIYIFSFNKMHLKILSGNWRPSCLGLNAFPDNKVHGANMGPTWVLSAQDGPHVGPMNLAIRVKGAKRRWCLSWFIVVLVTSLNLQTIPQAGELQVCGSQVGIIGFRKPDYSSIFNQAYKNTSLYLTCSYQLRFGTSDTFTCYLHSFIYKY